MATDRRGRRRRQKRAKLRRKLRDRTSIWDVVWGRSIWVVSAGALRLIKERK